MIIFSCVQIIGTFGIAWALLALVLFAWGGVTIFGKLCLQSSNEILYETLRFNTVKLFYHNGMPFPFYRYRTLCRRKPIWQSDEPILSTQHRSAVFGWPHVQMHIHPLFCLHNNDCLQTYADGKGRRSGLLTHIVIQENMCFYNTVGQEMTVWTICMNNKSHVGVM